MRNITLFLALCSMSVIANAQVPQILKDVNPGTNNGAGSSFSVVNNVLLFAGNDSITNFEPWVSDGTTAGTHLIGDIDSGANLSVTGVNAFYFNNRYYWMGFEPATGYELYMSDLTNNGTGLLKDFNPGSTNGNPYKAFELNNSLFIAALDVNGKRLLYKSDGTAANTNLLMSGNFFYGGWAIHMNGKVYFSASTDPASSSYELWETDGTATGTVLLKDINAGAPGSNPAYFTKLNGTRFMFAATDANGREMWISDGTSAGTYMVSNIQPGSSGSGPANLYTWNNRIYFAATGGQTGDELWVSDGTTTGTLLLKEINASNWGSNPESFIELNGLLLFSASDDLAGRELWSTDGTEAGTMMVKDIHPGGMPGIEFDRRLSLNGLVYFVARDSVHGHEIWSTDGTTAGTKMVYDLSSGSASGANFLTSLKNINDRIFFLGNDGNTGQEIFYFDTYPTAASETVVEENILQVYPNPTTSTVTIKTATGDVSSITISDALGRTILSSGVNNGSITLDISALRPGVYLLAATGENGISHTEKLVIQ